MKDEYIIINRTAIQKRIEELENIGLAMEHHAERYIVYKEILSESTPLIPEIEKAFDSSWFKAHGVMTNKEKDKQDYISNLKLDI